MSAVEILEELRRMPEGERRRLVEDIQNEFILADDELSPEQIAELERRAEEFRANPHNSLPWEQVRDEARKRFGWK